jgi:putative transcriptional regulator
MMRHWLIGIRKDNLMTQLDVARLAGISRAYYAQIELQKRDPSIRVARKLSRLLGFDWIRFYEETRAGTAVHTVKPHGCLKKGGGQIA